MGEKKVAVLDQANDAGAQFDTKTVAGSVDLADPNSNRIIKEMRGRNSTKDSYASLANFELTDSSSKFSVEKSGNDLSEEHSFDDLHALLAR